MKALANPPADVHMVMKAVNLLMCEPKLKKDLVANFPMDHITEKVLKAVAKITKLKEFAPSHIMKKSAAAG